MGRIVGDSGCHFEIVDIAVDANFQGQGCGTRRMQHIEKYLQNACPAGACVSMVADEPEFYRRFGDKEITPSLGMYKISKKSVAPC